MNEQEIYLFLKTLVDINSNPSLSILSLPIEHKEFMLAHNYIQPGNKCYEITQEGFNFLEDHKSSSNPVIVRYPLTNRGTIKNYNKVINTSSIQAKNAMLCAITNEDMIKDVEVKAFRVFMQYILDGNYHKKMGEELIRKYKAVIDQSVSFFDSKKK